MPLLNSRGDVLAGVAGVPGSLNGVLFPFASFGGGAWLDDDTALVSIPAPAPLEAVLATWRPGAPTPTPLPENRGANDWAAGGGRFFAWLAGFGAWGSLGHLPAAGFAGRLSVAPDGTVAYIPDRGYGYGLALVDPDGQAHDIPSIYAGQEQTIGRGAAIWTGGAYGVLVPVPACADAFAIQIVELPGERWLAYWSDSVGFVVQLDGMSDGYILGTSPTFFNHHARAINGTRARLIVERDELTREVARRVGDGDFDTAMLAARDAIDARLAYVSEDDAAPELLVTWSVTQGEGPTDVVRAWIDRTAPRVALVPPPPDPNPEPPDPPDPEPPDPEPPEPPDPKPEPPDPGPEPQPPEPQPEVRTMITIDLTKPPIEAVTGEKVDHGDGTVSVKFTDADGKVTYFGVDSAGEFHTDATEIGPDETFTSNGTVLIATNTYQGVKVRMLPCAETTAPAKAS